jgi:RNA polymerase sigma-70 factor, ECF subfamily
MTSLILTDVRHTPYNCQNQGTFTQALEQKMDDVEAMRRLKHGDIGGLETLIARYQVRAVRTAYLVTHDEPLAEDVVQDAFVRLFQRGRNFDESRPFEPYLMRSVINCALNAIEKNSRWVPVDGCQDSEALEALESLLVRAASVEEQVEFAQLKDEISTALSCLPPRQRAVIVQRYYLEMSEKEMAETLDIAPGTIKWLLNKARTRLRRLLGSQRSAQ